MMKTLLVHVLVHPKCGKLVLRVQKARPTVAQLMRMPPDMEPESVDGELQLLLPLTGYL